MMLDSNGDGKITPDDLSDMLKRLRIEIQTETIDELMRTASHSGVELMDENEFLAWVKRIQDVLPEQTSEDSRKDLMAAFQVFDLDHNGFITKDELKVAMEKIGEPLTDGQITYIIKMADLDMDGKINYEGTKYFDTSFC